MGQMNYKGKTCIVTGAAGAIGSRLCAKLLAAGARVIGLDDLSSGYTWLVPQGMDEASQFGTDGNVLEIDRILNAPHGCVVFHLAAHFANQNSVDNPIEDLQVNGEGTLRVLEWAAGFAERVVFASAGCAAGHANTPYQIHKTLGEAYCRYYADRVPTVICRFHNSYGPGEVPGLYRNVVPNWMWAAMHDQAITIYGDGTDGRDFIFVDDLVDGMMHAITPSGGGVVTLGTGILTSVHTLARAILQLTKSKSALVFEPSRRWDHPGKAAAVGTSSNPVPLLAGLGLVHEWMLNYHRQIKESLR